MNNLLVNCRFIYLLAVVVWGCGDSGTHSIGMGGKMPSDFDTPDADPLDVDDTPKVPMDASVGVDSHLGRDTRHSSADIAQYSNCIICNKHKRRGDEFVPQGCFKNMGPCWSGANLIQPWYAGNLYVRISVSEPVLVPTKLGWIGIVYVLDETGEIAERDIGGGNFLDSNIDNIYIEDPFFPEVVSRVRVVVAGYLNNQKVWAAAETSLDKNRTTEVELLLISGVPVDSDKDQIPDFMDICPGNDHLGC